jgi:DNA-binding XRE family transcriptional regulator
MRKNAKLPKVLGKKIQKRRKEVGLTQEDLGYKVGISRAYMGYIEQGRYAPSLEVLEKIAKALKTPIGDFFSKS